jgi:serine/threonine protein phosphatase PrpC
MRSRQLISVKRISCADSLSDDTTQSHTNSYATQEQAYTIFVASDGVWDCWKYDDLMQFINDELIKRNKNLLEMGEAVLEESISRAITNFGAKHYDDACLVVWQFTPTKPPPGTLSAASSPANHALTPSSASVAELNGNGDVQMRN